MSASKIRRSSSGLGPQTSKPAVAPVEAPAPAVVPGAMPLVRFDCSVPCEDTKYDPDLWYAESQSDTRLAKGICRMQCPMLATCLEGALERNEPFGVFGGMTARERRVHAGLEEAAQQAPTDQRHELWQHGKTDLEMAAILGVTANTVQKWRTRWTLPPNGIRGRRPSDAQADVERRDLYLRGFTDKQIAVELGMRTQAITRWRKRAGLPRHTAAAATGNGAGRVSA